MRSTSAAGTGPVRSRIGIRRREKRTGQRRKADERPNAQLPARGVRRRFEPAVSAPPRHHLHNALGRRTSCSLRRCTHRRARDNSCDRWRPRRRRGDSSSASRGERSEETASMSSPRGTGASLGCSGDGHHIAITFKHRQPPRFPCESPPSAASSCCARSRCQRVRAALRIPRLRPGRSNNRVRRRKGRRRRSADAHAHMRRSSPIGQSPIRAVNHGASRRGPVAFRSPIRSWVAISCSSAASRRAGDFGAFSRRGRRSRSG